MKRFQIKEIISSIFMFLFLYTALNKLFDLRTFKNVLVKSPLIHNKAAMVAIAIPIIETMVVLILFFPRTRLLGLYSSAVLMIIFTMYIAYMLVFTPNLPCSCGGVLKQMSWNQHLIFNVFFFLLALAGVVFERNTIRRKREYG